MPLTPAELPARLDLASRIAREFVRYGMDKHIDHLRTYYRTIRQGDEPGAGEWTHEMVIRWAQNLRLPPHEHDVPVKSRQSSCDCPSPQKHTVGVWPGGSRHKCGGCGVEWIELESS